MSEEMQRLIDSHVAAALEEAAEAIDAWREMHARGGALGRSMVDRRLGMRDAYDRAARIVRSRKP